MQRPRCSTCNNPLRATPILGRLSSVLGRGLVKQTIAGRLGTFVADTTFEQLPREVVEKAKRHALDTFGAALVGATSPRRPRGQKRLSLPWRAAEPLLYGASASLLRREMPLFSTASPRTPSNSTTRAAATTRARLSCRPLSPRYRCSTSRSSVERS